MIIAVNIHRSISRGNSVLESTRGAWHLSMQRSLEHKFVIGVARGKILGYFVLNGVNYFRTDPRKVRRVVFDLIPCDAQQQEQIEQYIGKANLKEFVIKYI
jgi:hypothetical protein